VLPAAEKRTPPKSMTAKSIGQLAIRQDVLLPSWLSAIAHYVLMGLVYGFVPLLAEELGASSWVVSNLSVIHLAVFTPSVLAATFLLRKFRLRPILVVSFVLIALGVACGAVATSVGWLLAVQVFVGIGYGVSYPILLGMSIEQVDSPQRATAMGVHQSVYSIGMFAGPWLSGILAASMGLKPMFAVTAIASLVLGVLGSFWATAKNRAATGSV
jgi:MFS family permease